MDDGYITVKITGETSNLYENKEILGHGQVVDGYKLENGKKYIFSKIKEYYCYDEPFSYDEESDLKLYQDNCHTLSYTFKNGNLVISTDDVYYIENKDNEENFSFECEQVMYTSALAIASAGFAAYTTPIGWVATLGLITAVSSSTLSTAGSCLPKSE
eukprot:jgi/Orpsp1_1/1186081/evm.model.c7180000096779.1